jgi:hypothetical protein
VAVHPHWQSSSTPRASPRRSVPLSAACS